MRRLPIFVCVDVSESMAGESLKAVQGGLETMLLALKKDPMVIEIGAISVISFGARAKVEVPLSSILDVQLPQLRLSSGTSLGAAIDLLSSEIASKVTKTTAEMRGDYKPIIFIITDGQPTDDWESSLRRFQGKNRSLSLHAIGCGDDIDFSMLKKITPNCYALRDMNADSFAKLFKCVSASIQCATNSIATGGEKREDLTEWSGGALEKPNSEDCAPRHGTKQVMLSVTCSRTSKQYLLRYHLNDNEQYVCVAAHPLIEPLDGGSVKAGQIHASRLSNPHSCPYCGNQALVHCQCGELSCISPGASEMRCPSCGECGTISYDSNFSVDRSKG